MWTNYLEALIKADQIIFFAINKYGHIEWLDGLMLLLRNSNTWIVLYLLVLYKIYKRKPNMILPFILASLITFAITDFTSASIIKPWVGRLRPCYDADVSADMYQLVACGGKYSFPSSHAANHFGLATIWFNIVLFLTQKKWYWVWPWATIICYAQIYVGKHFPLDIAGGALLGILAGLLVSNLFILVYKKMNGNFNFLSIPKTLQPDSS